MDGKIKVFKVCTKCGFKKSGDSFYRDSRGRGYFGLFAHCKKCHSLYSKTEHSRKLRRDYKDKVRSNPGYVKKEREKSRLRMRGYLKDPVKRKQLYLKNSANATKRLKTDIAFRVRRNLRVRLSKLISGKFKSGSSVSDLGCSVDFFIKYIESKFYPHPITGDQMNWCKWGKGKNDWNLDHIKELSNFNLLKRGELLEACNFKNIQPLWFIDHKKKTCAFLTKN